MLETWLASPAPGRGRPEESGVNASRGAVAGDGPRSRRSATRARLTTLPGRAATCGIGAVLIGVGADLRYLTGYVALPLERLTMLDRPRVAAARRWSCRASRPCPPGRSPAGRGRLVDLVTWIETEDPDRRSSPRLVARRGRGSPCRTGSGRCSCCASSRRCRRARFDLASVVLRDLRIVKDDDESQLLRLAAHAADRVIAQMAARPARRPHRGAMSPARSASGFVAEGHDTAEFAIVGSGPNSRVAASRGVGPRDPGRRAARCSTSAGRSAGTAAISRGSSGSPAATPPNGPDDDLPAPVRRPPGRAGGGDAGVRPGIPAERVDGIARGMIDDGRLRASVHPPDRSRDRPRGARGAVSRGREHRAAAAGHGLQHRARHLPRRALRRAHRGHRRVRPATARSS